MVLPLLKLGTLALKTLSKPIAARLKREAGIHPKFRNVIVSIAQVAVAALFFEVQRNTRSEAKKEELRKQEMQGMRQRDDELAKEVEILKQKIKRSNKLPRDEDLLVSLISGILILRKPSLKLLFELII